MDTYAASTDFNSIQNKIISLAANPTRVLFQEIQILFLGGSKGMMHCSVPFFIVVILQ